MREPHSTANASERERDEKKQNDTTQLNSQPILHCDREKHFRNCNLKNFGFCVCERILRLHKSHLLLNCCQKQQMEFDTRRSIEEKKSAHNHSAEQREVEETKNTYTHSEQMIQRDEMNNNNKKKQPYECVYSNCEYRTDKKGSG